MGRLTLGLILGVAGCSADVVSDPTPAPDVNVPVYRETSGYGHLALVKGRLAVDDGCLVLDLGSGRFLGTSWPPGTEWGDETRQILVGGVVMAEVGDTVELGGGQGTPPDNFGPDRWIVSPTRACTSSLEAYWRVSDIEVVERGG